MKLNLICSAGAALLPEALGITTHMMNNPGDSGGASGNARRGAAAPSGAGNTLPAELRPSADSNRTEMFLCCQHCC